MTTTHRWGATPEEWTWAAALFGADLLPAVHDPHHQNKTPRMASLPSMAKTPSMISRTGLAHGITGWVRHVATPNVVHEWSLDPALGILLNTRHVRAIDIDIEDRTYADQVENWLCQSLEIQPHVRYRPDSGKRTLLVALDPNPHLAKRVIHTPFGAIEFLASGQQTALCGTHPNGQRFAWRRGATQGLDPNPVSVVPLPKLMVTWDVLVASAGQQSDKRFSDLDDTVGENLNRNASGVAHDPVVDYMAAEGLIEGYESNGVVNVKCPWEDKHTSSGKNSTSWMPAGLGGKEVGGFKCLHAHCQELDTRMFLRLIGYTQKEQANAFVEGLLEVQTSRQFAEPSVLGSLPATPPVLQGMYAPAVTEAAAARALAVQSDVPELDLRRNKRGEPLAIVSNLLTIVAADKAVVEAKYDTFEATQHVRLAGSDWRKMSDLVITSLRDIIERKYEASFPHQEMSRAVHHVADEAKYDSAIEWISKLQWDGVKRVEFFSRDILKTEDTNYTRLCALYMWVAMAARVLCPGVKADMTPVLISKRQGTGKSSLVAAIAPFENWHGLISLSDRDDDTSRIMRGKVVLEIPEMKGLEGRDNESIKAWLTKQVEEWTPKYMEYPIQYPRRSLLIGTHNQDRFMADATGGRRFLPMWPATTAEFIDHPRLRTECEQYWAEAKEMVLKFAMPIDAVEYYSSRANAAATEARERASVLDPIHNTVVAAARSGLGSHTTFSLWRAANPNSVPSPADGRRISSIMTIAGYDLDNEGYWHKPFVL